MNIEFPPDLVVQVGDVWKDKDKRRNTVIEILAVKIDGMNGHDDSTDKVTGLVVGTEEERTYSVDRLVKRWELVTRKDDIVWLPANRAPWSYKGEPQLLTTPAHVHNDRGECLKNRYGQRCNQPPEPKTKRADVRHVSGRNWHLLVQCAVDGEKGQRFRTTMKQFETFGAPLCGCHHKAMNLIEKH